MESFSDLLQTRFSAVGGKVHVACDEITVVIPATHLLDVMIALRDEFEFQQLIDVAGIDYTGYHGYSGARFAVVYHLLSLTKNRRLRVRAFCENDNMPALASVCDIWPAAGWFEREAFDLFGIVFHGHDDLRRLLTDYGFVGHPFRKDFPLSGHIEMRYDPTEKRVIYQPVSIEPREVTPRIVREETFADNDG